jgi:inorganic pyrophosphatase
MNKTVDAVIEISALTRNKYEWDDVAKRFRFNRTLSTSVKYPVNYGFFPNTLASDGDPADCLVPSIEPIEQGCIVEVRPIGILKMIDQGIEDFKVLAIPVTDYHWKHIKKLSQVTPHLLDEIEHFFGCYKDLENKIVKINGWGKRKEALTYLKKAVKRFESQ